MTFYYLKKPKNKKYKNFTNKTYLIMSISNININIIENIDYYKYNNSLGVFLDALYNQLNNPAYLYLNNELTKYVSYEPELTYCDLIVYKIINHPKYYTKPYNKQQHKTKSYNVYQNFEKMYQIITKFLYNTPEKINQLLIHIENLNLDNFERIMSDSRTHEIDINNLYSHKQLEIALGYLIIFSSILNNQQNNNENNQNNQNNENNENNQNNNYDIIWKLLQYSVIYANKLKDYIKNQVQYFKILNNYFKCYGKIYKRLFKYVVDLESFNYKINLYLKHKNIFQYLEPRNLDEWRIYYSFYLLNKYYNKKFNMFNFKIIPLELNKSYYLNELCILSLNNFYYDYYDNKYNNKHNNDIIDNDIESLMLRNHNLKLLFWVSTNNLLNDIEYIIQYNLTIISSINYILNKIEIQHLNDSYDNIFNNETYNFTMDNWKNKYFNMTLELLSFLKITNARIYENYNKIYRLLKNNNNNVKINYADLGNLAIDLYNYKKIFNELPKIFDIIIRKSLNFDQYQIEKVIYFIFDLYYDPNLKKINNYFELFKKINQDSSLQSLHSEQLTIYNIKNISMEDSYLNLELIFLKKVISYLKKTNQNNQNNQLYDYLINMFNESDLKNKYLDSKYFTLLPLQFKMLLKNLKTSSSKNDIELEAELEEFLDPITNILIKEPMVLPQTFQIIEKKVIYQILKNNSTNPFNGLQLTIKELEDFNNQNEIKEKINHFKEQLEKIQTSKTI